MEIAFGTVICQTVAHFVQRKACVILVTEKERPFSNPNVVDCCVSVDIVGLFSVRSSLDWCHLVGMRSCNIYEYPYDVVPQFRNIFDSVRFFFLFPIRAKCYIGLLFWPRRIVARTQTHTCSRIYCAIMLDVTPNTNQIVKCATKVSGKNKRSHTIAEKRTTNFVVVGKEIIQTKQHFLDIFFFSHFWWQQKLREQKPSCKLTRKACA